MSPMHHVYQDTCKTYVPIVNCNLMVTLRELFLHKNVFITIIGYVSCTETSFIAFVPFIFELMCLKLAICVWFCLQPVHM